MCPKRKPEPSIRRQLLLWLMLPLCGVWLVTTVATCYFGTGSSNKLFDQLLLDSADSVIARISIKGENVSVPLPESAREIIERGVDHFYFRVKDQITGKTLLEDGKIELREPLQLPTDYDDPVFAYGTAEGKRVRVAGIKVIDAETHRSLILEVAETLNSRDQLANHILLNILLSELVVILIGSLAIAIGVTRGLTPLRDLQQAIAQRTPADLSHIDESNAPMEALPLVQALNDLLDRLKVEIDSQKRFVANAAHQIRTPVAGMKTYVGLARRLANSEELTKILEHVDEGTDRLTHLTNRLLSLAKAEPNAYREQNYTVMDLNMVIPNALVELVSKAISKEIELEFEGAVQPALVRGNEASIEELVLNIVENAILYTPAGGHVSVRVTNGNGVTLSVEDDGPGIPQSERDQVFERFYRILGSEVSGSGLGLAIVKEIAAAHGATVVVDSGQSGTGTLVKVQLQSARTL
jgi:two-component system, OmpR family, sensor histidine kinase TctE